MSPLKTNFQKLRQLTLKLFNMIRSSTNAIFNESDTELLKFTKLQRKNLFPRKLAFVHHMSFCTQLAVTHVFKWMEKVVTESEMKKLIHFR